MTDKIKRLIDSINKVIVGKEDVIKYSLCPFM